MSYFNDRDKRFIQHMKAQGVSKEEAYERLMKVKSRFEEENKPKENKVLNSAGSLLKGAAKGLATTVTNGSNSFQNTAANLYDKVGLDGVADDIRSSVEMSENFKEENFTPENKLEKAGFAVEQIAEFLIPMSGSAKVVKAAKGAINSTKVGGALVKAARKPNASLAAKGAKNLIDAAPKVVTDGASFGAIAALQEGEINKEALFTAGIGAAFPAAGAATKTFTEPVRQVLKTKVPSKIINSLIKPPKKAFSFGRDPGGAVAKEGIVANSLDDLFSKIKIKKKEIGGQIDDLVSDGAERTNATQLMDEYLNKNAGKVADEAGRKRLMNILDELNNVTEFKGGKFIKVGEKDLTSLSAKELHKLQRSVGNFTTWTGAPYEKEVNKVLAGLYTKIGLRLDTVSPGTKALQRRYSNLLGAEKAAEARAATASRLNVVLGLSPALMGGAAGLSSALNGGDSTENIITAMMGVLMTKGLGTTAAKTRVANALANAQRKKLPEEMIMAIKAVLAELGGDILVEEGVNASNSSKEETDK